MIYSHSPGMGRVSHHLGLGQLIFEQPYDRTAAAPAAPAPPPAYGQSEQ